MMKGGIKKVRFSAEAQSFIEETWGLNPKTSRLMHYQVRGESLFVFDTARKSTDALVIPITHCMLELEKADTPIDYLDKVRTGVAQ